MMAVCSVPNLESLANLFGCVVSVFPRTFLGLPLGWRLKTKHIWDPVVERVDQRLARWKCCYLSKGGRITLIKNALSNLPVYFMSCFWAQLSVL